MVYPGWRTAHSISYGITMSSQISMLQDWHLLWDYEIWWGHHELTIIQCCRTAYGISPDRNLRDRQVIFLLFTLSWHKDKRCKTGRIILSFVFF